MRTAAQVPPSTMSVEGKSTNCMKLPPVSMAMQMTPIPAMIPAMVAISMTPVPLQSNPTCRLTDWARESVTKPSRLVAHARGAGPKGSLSLMPSPRDVGTW